MEILEIGENLLLSGAHRRWSKATRNHNMKRQWCPFGLRSAFELGGLLFLGFAGTWASAQEPVVIRSSPHVIVTNATEDTAPPVSPKTSPGPMSLDACIETGFRHQPAMDAAQASLAV